MIGRVLVSLGLPLAAVGFTLYGMGTSYVDPDDGYKNLGLILMVGGIVAAAIGYGIHRATEGTERSAARRR